MSALREELQKETTELADRIQELVRQFQVKTGFSVVGVDLTSHYTNKQLDPEMTIVNIKVGLGG